MRFSGKFSAKVGSIANYGVSALRLSIPAEIFDKLLKIGGKFVFFSVHFVVLFSWAIFPNIANNKYATNLISWNLNLLEKRFIWL